jgi:Uma2 family endonuclease
MNYITDINQLDLSKEYTYSDYLTWRVRERIELIMGRIFRMSPAPSSEHQQIVSALHANIYQYLRNKSCRVFPSPFDVVLSSPSGKQNNVVQPDISVICDLSKITEKGCMGAPDLVVEVVSKSSVNKDLHENYVLYEQHGVMEYWLVLPAERSLIIFTLDNQGKYQPAKPLTKGDIAVSHVLGGIRVDLDEIFPTLAEEPEVEGYGMEYNRV